MSHNDLQGFVEYLPPKKMDDKQKKSPSFLRSKWKTDRQRLTGILYNQLINRDIIGLKWQPLI